MNLGTHELAAGEHVLGMVAQQGSGALELEQLRLLRLPPPGQREVKNHNEAHFIRLGIGRAVYAHRLAYGELPCSLEELVEKRLLKDRYLRDENGHPLRSTCDGASFSVHSTADGGWSYECRGLDARR